MDVREINACLTRGEIDRPHLLPHLSALSNARFAFRFDFGLSELPEEPGVILVRGARQYGKSTWLEQQIASTVRTFGAGSALYLNGDEIEDAGALVRAVRSVVPAFDRSRPVARLFIDEITAVRDWPRGIKRLVDAGEVRDVLVVTTGSHAADLRHGAERLPGRKGKLARTAWLFTPIPYADFVRVCGATLGTESLTAYLLAGGSPPALSEIAAHGHLPEHVIETTRDWVQGEFSASGRSRARLLSVMNVIVRHAGAPLGQARLARDAGLANNTVAAGYVELLMDLLCLGECLAWDASRRAEIARKPAKYPFVNLLAATSWHPARLRAPADFSALPEAEQGGWIEWLVAQELWRRRAVLGVDVPERLRYWRGGEHELDYVVSNTEFIEVKRGRASPLELTWFPRVFPRGSLTVINTARFRAQGVRGVTLEDFLLDETWKDTTSRSAARG